MEALGRLSPADLALVMSSYHQALEAHREALNRLNVYPVPDGDTGTNMALTVDSVVSELATVEGFGALGDSSGDVPAGRASIAVRNDVAVMAEVCRAISHGSLMGARGNSGVILSQLLRGMTGVLADSSEPGGRELSEALGAASEAAYKAVLRPVEGTILTVARAAAEGAASGRDRPLVETLESARASAEAALSRTPELLPVLAQAGVVDAGGAGYLLLLDAFLEVVDARPIPKAASVAPQVMARAWPLGDGPTEAGTPGGADLSGSAEHGGLRYEVMYFLDAPDDTVPAFKEVWEGIGDSIVVVGGDGLWNCHIHTNDVGAAIEAALDVGRPRDIRVSDLADQVAEERWVREGADLAAPQAIAVVPPTRTAVVAVANGEGVGRIFRSLGVHHLVAGGQSMNPSTAQILEVVEATPSEDVVILPNNENIVPVAMQVCELSKKTTRVVPTCGIVEGFAALLEYDPEAGAQENVDLMSASARRVIAGEVTQAVRDSTGPAGPIRQGDWMGLSREGVELVGASMSEAACGLLGKLLRSDHELVTLIEGEGALQSQTREITEWLAEEHPRVAVEVHHGGQPLYPYLLSIE